MTHLNDVLTATLDALPLGIAWLDGDEQVAFINRTLAEWLPAARDWVGRPWAAGWGTVGVEADGDELRLGGRQLRRSQGALPGQGRLEIFEDLTPLRDCEDGLREMFVVWDEASAFHAHELRNPLTAILGFGTLLRDRPTAAEEKRREWAGRTVEKAQAMRESIELYSTTSRFLAERHRFQRAALDLARLVEEVVRDGGGRPPALPDGPCWVNGDADRLRQLLHILLTHARQHAPTPDSVRVRLALEEGQAVLRISDGGDPMPADVQAAIFEPLRDGAAGSRVDLTIARGLASAHGGALEFTAAPDQGNTFTLSLPVLAEQDIPPGS